MSPWAKLYIQAGQHMAWADDWRRRADQDRRTAADMGQRGAEWLRLAAEAEQHATDCDNAAQEYIRQAQEIERAQVSRTD